MEFGIPADELLDFSANINPRGLPAGALLRLRREAADPRLLMRYPDPSAGELRSVLSRRLQLPPGAIAIGAGAEALIAASLGSLGARRCLVPVPAFSEYARACAACGAVFEPFALDPQLDFRLNVEAFCRALRSGQRDCAVVNNPHNPSGALLAAAEVRRILDTAEAGGVRVLLDEAFIDYARRASLVQEAVRRPGVMVVRSLTKFYGCPALRAGYAVGAPPSIARLAASTPTWPVTLLALNSLSEALGDDLYAETTLRENEFERPRLAASLAAMGAHVFPAAANFLLVRLPAGWPAATSIRQRLISEHRILVRNCDSYAGLEKGRYLRVAVRTAAENGRLMEAFKQVVKERT
ncbi:MAG: aminotransferase class I/II-fold pyridoxal phosphate-dependent enzyme [Acidobacteria bacterium]|nr:aminotransferase class I/II-fold pyridoxal phosphate-dependent enzyme [Acidobacteriota bacterium]